MLMLVASPFALTAVAFIVPQFGLFFVTLAFLSVIALNVVGAWLVRRLVRGAPRFLWPVVSLALAATFSGVFVAATTLVALPAEIAYLAALIGTMVVTGLLWRGDGEKQPHGGRGMLGQARKRSGGVGPRVPANNLGGRGVL